MILVTEQNSLHVCRHAFSRPFHAQTLVPMCHGYFNHTFDRKHYPNNRTIACSYALFGSLASLRIIPLVAPSILSTFFNPFILRIDNKFKPPRLDRSFLFEGFFQNLPLSLISVITQLFILNSWETCQRCAKILLAAEHKMQLSYYLRNTEWFQRCSEFGFFDKPFIILFIIFY